MSSQKIIACLLVFLLLLLPLSVCGCTDGGEETGTESSAPVKGDETPQEPSPNPDDELPKDPPTSESNPEGSGADNGTPEGEPPGGDQVPEGGKPEGSDKPVVELPFVPFE